MQSAPQRVRGHTDTDVDVALTGAYPAGTVVHGASFTREAGRVVLHLPAGSFDVTLTTTPAAPAVLRAQMALPNAGDPVQLPNTNTPVQWAPGLGALAATCCVLAIRPSRRRRRRSR